MCIEGILKINDGKHTLEEADAMQIYGQHSLKLAAPEDNKGHLLIVELAKDGPDDNTPVLQQQ